METNTEIFKTEIIDSGVLTPRETEILRCVADAMTDKQIASSLEISLKTVTHHIDHIHTKLNLRCHTMNKRVAVLRVAMARGMIRVVCFGLAVSAGIQADNEALAARAARTVRPSVSRRYE